jgi:hypothetical protein
VKVLANTGQKLHFVFPSRHSYPIVLTVYGHTEGAVVAYNLETHGRASYQTFVGTEADSGTTIQGEHIASNRLTGEHSKDSLFRCLHRLPSRTVIQYPCLFDNSVSWVKFIVIPMMLSSGSLSSATAL